MQCIDCLQNCPEIISDQCVQYTGPTIPAPLGICQGSQLPVFEANVIAVIQSIIAGTGVLPTPLNTNVCTWINQQFGILPLNLTNIAQVLINNDCSLYGMIAALQQQVTNSSSGTVIDTACLTGLPVSPTQPQILQAVITLLCSVNTTVTGLPNVYVTQQALPSLVTPIVNQIISGGSSTVQYNSRMVPYAALPYFGPLSNFDNTGAGLSTLGFANVYLCNGNNGTPDMRGYVPVGAIRSVPGGAMLPNVDPTVSPNNPNWQLLQTQGETAHALTAAEDGPHTHTITDPGHTHPLSLFLDSKGGSSGTPVLSSANNGRGSFSGNTLPGNTGITVNTAGGGQPHNNIQPSIGCYFIMYIP